MKKHIMLIATLTALCAVCFADETQCIAEAQTPSQASEAANSPHVIKTVRSPLGKEIDATNGMLAKLMLMTKEAFVEQHAMLTNLSARVEKLEAAEAERVKRSQAAREAAKKRAEERKAGRQEKASARETLQGVIRRGQKAAKREGK